MRSNQIHFDEKQLDKIGSRDVKDFDVGWQIFKDNQINHEPHFKHKDKQLLLYSGKTNFACIYLKIIVISLYTPVARSQLNNFY